MSQQFGRKDISEPVVAQTFWSESQGTLFVSGVVDQNLDFSSFTISVPQFKIDFSGLKRISSYGLENICSFLRRFHLAQIEFINCPPQLVIHFPVIAELLPFNVKVTSYLARFDCASCGAHEVVRFKVNEKNFSSTRPCIQCGATAEIENYTEEYLGFLQRIGQKI